MNQAALAIKKEHDRELRRIQSLIDGALAIPYIDLLESNFPSRSIYYTVDSGGKRVKVIGVDVPEWVEPYLLSYYIVSKGWRSFEVYREDCKHSIIILTF